MSFNDDQYNYRLLSDRNDRQHKHYDNDGSDHTIHVETQSNSRSAKKRRKRVRFTSTKVPTIVERLYYGYDRLAMKTQLKMKVTILGILTLLSIVLIRRFVPPVNDDLLTHLNININISTRTFQLSNWTRPNQILLSGKLGYNIGFEIPRVTAKTNQLHLLWEDRASLAIDRLSDDCTSFTWQPIHQGVIFSDCFDLNRGYWYSGSEMHQQLWPLKDTVIPSQLFTTSYKLTSFGPVIEKVWFNSYGFILTAYQTTQLFVQVTKNRLCLQSRDRTLQYQVCHRHNIKQIYQVYAKQFYGNRSSTVTEEHRLFHSITWTMLNQNANTNQSMIDYYADQIIRYQFNNHSILEITDCYATSYGDFDFDPKRFPNINKTILQLHQSGLKISLSVSMIANINSKAFQYGIQKNYWVRRKDKNGDDVVAVIKWPGGNGVLLDVTNPSARHWFTTRLTAFQRRYNIDYFNFLQGYADYLPTDAVTFQPLDDLNHYTRLFNMMTASIMPTSQVEVAYQSQELNQVIQMARKDSSWNNVTGLPSIITSAITLGLIGYPLFTPATISSIDFPFLSTNIPIKVDRELYIRWIQLSTYLPILKLSIGPWNFDIHAVAFLQQLVKFRQQILVSKFIQCYRQLLSDNLPIIRPIWWLVPEDAIAQKIYDQFMIGDHILVAPIVQKKTNSRKIYLPRGHWFDAISKKNYTVAVGRWLPNYTTHYTQVAYFIYSPWK